MSLSRAKLIEMLSEARPTRWPEGFVADKNVFGMLLEIADDDRATEEQVANALYWLFRLRDYGNIEQLFMMFTAFTRHRSRRVRSEAVWLLTGWTAIQGVAGHALVEAATRADTRGAIRGSVEIGLERWAELRAKAFLEHREILDVAIHGEVNAGEKR